jgi:hypothetical protein
MVTQMLSLDNFFDYSIGPGYRLEKTNSFISDNQDTADELANVPT